MSVDHEKLLVRPGERFTHYQSGHVYVVDFNGIDTSRATKGKRVVCYHRLHTAGELAETFRRERMTGEPEPNEFTRLQSEFVEMIEYNGKKVRHYQPTKG